MNDLIFSHNIEIEQATIGCALLRGCAPSIGPSTFYRDSHRKIVEIMQSMERQKRPIDLVLLWEHLSAHGEIEKVGGATYLAECMDMVSNPDNLDAYQSVVLRYHRKRRLQAMATHIGSEANNPTPEQVSSWVSGLESALVGSNGEEGARFLMEDMRALVADLDAKQEHGGGLLGLSSGLTNLDREISGLCASDLIVLAGRPGMGKTALATTIAANVASAGHKVLFFSLEMDRKQLLCRLVAQRSGVNLQALRSGSLDGSDYCRAATAMASICDLPILLDDRPGRTELEIALDSKKHRPDLVIVDYLGFVRCSVKTDRKDLEIAHITARLKGLAKDLGVPVLLLCQLNRKIEDRAINDRRPFLSDLRDSGSIEQDADLVMFVHTAEKIDPDTADKGISEIVIGKHRNGPTCVIPMAFVATSTAFHDLGLDESSAFWHRKAAGKKRVSK
jgi:replicative DNA helicase